MEWSKIINAAKDSRLQKYNPNEPLQADNLLKLRNYVGHSIKEICAFDKSKNDFLTTLDSNGYGSKLLRTLKDYLSQH